jgi:hypothetical protein
MGMVGMSIASRAGLAENALSGQVALVTGGVRDWPGHHPAARRVSEPEDVAAVIGFLCLAGARQITARLCIRASPSRPATDVVTPYIHPIFTG